MLAEARGRSARVDWVQGDIAGFHPEVAPELIFTNAALHWLTGLSKLVPRLRATARARRRLRLPGPAVAFRRLVRRAARDHRRGPLGRPAGGGRGDPARGSGRATGTTGWRRISTYVDIWTTTYLHALEGDDPIVDWMSGTGLRPYLEALEDEAERQAFCGVYALRLAPLFPKRRRGDAAAVPAPVRHRASMNSASTISASRRRWARSWVSGRSSASRACTAAT